MKTILLILGLMVFAPAYSQLEDIRFTGYVKTDPVATFKDGFNFGVGINYQTNIFYIEAQSFVFPDLNNLTYLDLGGGVGLNWHSRFREWRIYGGGIGAVISRGGNGGYCYIGLEAGIDYYFNGENDGFFVGLHASRVMRTDSKIWSNDDHFMVNNGHIKIGFTF